MKTLESFKRESENYDLLEDFVLSIQEWKKFSPGTRGHMVKTYNSSGKLINIEYVLKGIENHDEVLEDMRCVSYGYFTETWSVVRK